MNETYHLKEDIEAYLDTHKETIGFLADKTGLSSSLLAKTANGVYVPDKKSLERLYSFFYNDGLRLNKAKCEVYQEEIKDGETLLFHGSKDGLDDILSEGARPDCDFGHGFYCSLFLSSAASFVCGFPNASCYVFKLDMADLKTEAFSCDLDWMLSICFNRGMLSSYKNNRVLNKLAERINKADVIIAPIADNKMFQVMRLFGEGEINSAQAMHALSASSLGNQYVLKTEKAISQLNCLEELFLPSPEKDEYSKEAVEREKLIQTKLDYAKRQYRNQGKYIDELLK